MRTTTKKKRTVRSPLLAVLASIQHQNNERQTLKEYWRWWDHSFLQGFEEQMQSNEKQVAPLAFFLLLDKVGLLDGPKTLCIRTWSIEKFINRIKVIFLKLLGRPRHVLLVAGRIALHSGRRIERVSP